MYPNQGYPPQPGYPPQQQGYPPQQPGYPPQQPGYPPQQPGFPPQQPGYPPQQPGYPPQQPGYPPQQPGYPPQQPGFPPQQPGYPPQQPDFAAQQYAPQFGYQQQPAVQQPMMQQQHVGQQHGAPPPQQYGAPPTQYRPTIRPTPNFDAANDCATLRKAMKGFGTDEDAIINVLCRRTHAERMEIVRAFKTAYGKDLIENIKSETKNNFMNLLVALLTPIYQFYATELYDAMYGKGTDETVLIEVLCGQPNREIFLINQFFAGMYGKTLEEALKDDTSGCFKRILVSLATGGRDESMRVDPNSAKTDAQALKAAGIGRWGTDESEFNRILLLRNTEQIKLIAREYEALTGHPLEKDIKKEFSGDIEDAMLAVLRSSLDRSDYFARRLHSAMAGLGTNDRDLIRLVVTRSEIDMVDIKEAFTRKYGKTLKSFIKGDTSGDYRHALYALIGDDRS